MVGSIVPWRRAAAIVTLLLPLAGLASCSPSGDPVGSAASDANTSGASRRIEPEPRGTASVRRAPSTGATADRTTGGSTNGPCVDLVATARISSRDAGNSWTVTGLDGEVSNPSPTDARVTTLYLQFKPGIPPDVHTAELTVPVDLAVAAGASAHWAWTGSILVRPFHDDAPQPEVDEIDWLWADPSVQERCDNEPG